ncbi:superoxide dismutase family protein [Winogradskyella poriferorum]|uniref:Superoxide dismutase family protein n=1 Tax=Winogradskyella poriferorum TaxID=307627 RepID=A0ABU7W6L7_9FLAO|tara:strand:- start:961 stop:1542 length:582 start_codon:yes stop_codon:yes gene_type:complete
MKYLKLSILTLAVAFATSCKDNKKETEETVETEVEKTAEPVITKTEMKIKLDPKSGSNATGSIVFVEENGEVTMTAHLSGLNEGEHAIHIHESADCSSPDGKSTGGHWNPTAQPHGKWGAETGYHKGDIGNFKVDANGKGEIKFTTDEWCLTCEDSTKNIIGKAIIVHQGTDDFTSQPSGAAGSRVSCGAIIE